MPDILIQPSTGTGAWADVEAGSYDAVIDIMEDAGISTMYPDDGPQLKISFALVSELDEDGNPIILNRWISQKWSDKSNLFKLAVACGLQPDASLPFQVSTLEGGECQIVVEIKNPGTDKQRPGISTFLPRQKAKAGKPRPAAAKPASEAGSTCAVEGCKAEVDKYTSRGTPLCASHTADDL
jgi:hypothetical protein